MTSQENEVTVQEARYLIEKTEVDILKFLRMKTEQIKERTGKAIQVTDIHINMHHVDMTSLASAYSNIGYWVSDVHLETDFNMRR